MSQNIQAVVPDDLAERVARAAEKEGRSVSSWVRRVLERELAGTVPITTDAVEEMMAGVEEMERRGAEPKFHVNPLPPCTHDLAAKRQTSFGFVRDCIKCGAVVKV